MSGTDMTVSVMPVAVIRLVYIVGGACASGRHLPSAGNESDDETVITMAWSKGLILRDGFIATLSEADWDAVIAVHLKGHFSVLRHAAEYWMGQSKAGDQPRAAIINTASSSGTTVPNPGQANYGSAKAAIAALTLVAADGLKRYGVRVNAIAPIADSVDAGHSRNRRIDG